ncbi:hypothetical protein LCGC14_2804390 [marine sediment metagenome]|uniref:Bacteriophage T4 Gp32 single-stranded DNA-binding domain-containing protein n=1 Tax=marine sediment metagenome TaxID=412755 RepID=A0A0F8Z8L4_9ZZZZ
MTDLNELPEGFGQADPDFMHEAYAEAKKERSETGDVLFLKSGVTHVFVLPPHKDAPSWFREYREHGIRPEGKFTTITCPKEEGDPCPICEAAAVLWDEKTNESITAAKRLTAKKQFLYNVYVFSSPDGKALKDGIHTLKSGVTVYKELMAYDSDDAGGWGNITDLTRGVEFRIERTGRGRFDTKYSAMPVPQRTNLLEKLDAAGFKIGPPTDLTKVYPARKYDALLELLEQDVPEEEKE